MHKDDPVINQSGCHGMSLVGFDYCSVDHSLLCMKNKLWIPFLTFTFPPSFTGFEGCSQHMSSGALVVGHQQVQ